MGARRRRPVIAALLGGAAIAALWLAAIAAFGLAAAPRPAPLAVVFGNKIEPSGVPSPRLAARLDAALHLFRAGLAERILVSGGIEPGGADEAAAMRAWLLERGVPPSAILSDPGGTDTWRTAIHTAALDPRPDAVIVVTQWFHVARAELAMRRLGIARVSAAWPCFVEVRDAYSLLREAVALPWYALRPRPARPGAGAAPTAPPPAGRAA